MHNRTRNKMSYDKVDCYLVILLVENCIDKILCSCCMPQHLDDTSTKEIAAAVGQCSLRQYRLEVVPLASPIFPQTIEDICKGVCIRLPHHFDVIRRYMWYLRLPSPCGLRYPIRDETDSDHQHHFDLPLECHTLHISPGR